MSSIFGIYRLGHDRPVERDLRDMAAALDHWLPDDRGFRCLDQALLGHLMLHNTPESLHEKQPFTAVDCHITADARIDNRDEIIRKLRDHFPVGEQTPDSTLILYLYLDYGRECVHHLVGDFAFAVWDQRSQALFCARDPMGVKNIFYYDKEGLFAFATEARGILAMPWVDASRNDAFAEHLLTDTDPSPDSTFHTYVRRLLPGHYLQVSNAGLELTRYWHPSIPPRLKFRNPAEYHEAFLDQLKTAIRCRLRTVFPVSAELSGGLDSSGITALAASLIGDKDSLFTFSNVLPSDGEGRKPFRDEEYYIDQVIQHCGIRHAVKVKASGRQTPLDFHDLELAVNSGVDVYSAWWQEPLRREMSARNIRVTLSGFGGDEGVTNKADGYFKDFIREGEILKFLHAVHARGMYSLPFRMMARELIPASMMEKIRHRRTSDTRLSFLTDKQRGAELAALGKISAGQVKPGFRQRILQLISRDYTFQRVQSEGQFGIMHRLEPRFPLLDTRLLQFYLGLPLDIIGNPRQNRHVFRQSMQGILPEEVRLRSDKLVSAGIYYMLEARDNASFFTEWLKERQDDDGYASMIDVQQMIRGWDIKDPANWKESMFIPRSSFRAECLLRFSEQHTRK